MSLALMTNFRFSGFCASRRRWGCRSSFSYRRTTPLSSSTCISPSLLSTSANALFCLSLFCSSRLLVIDVHSLVCIISIKDNTIYYHFTTPNYINLFVLFLTSRVQSLLNTLLKNRSHEIPRDCPLGGKPPGIWRSSSLLKQPSDRQLFQIFYQYKFLGLMDEWSVSSRPPGNTRYHQT